MKTTDGTSGCCTKMFILLTQYSPHNSNVAYHYLITKLVIILISFFQHHSIFCIFLVKLGGHYFAHHLKTFHTLSEPDQITDFCLELTKKKKSYNKFQTGYNDNFALHFSLGILGIHQGESERKKYCLSPGIPSPSPPSSFSLSSSY